MSVYLKEHEVTNAGVVITVINVGVVITVINVGVVINLGKSIGLN